MSSDSDVRSVALGTEEPVVDDQLLGTDTLVLRFTKVTEPNSSFELALDGALS